MGCSECTDTFVYLIPRAKIPLICPLNILYTQLRPSNEANAIPGELMGCFLIHHISLLYVFQNAIVLPCGICVACNNLHQLQIFCKYLIVFNQMSDPNMRTYWDEKKHQIGQPMSADHYVLTHLPISEKFISAKFQNPTSAKILSHESLVLCVL